MADRAPHASLSQPSSADAVRVLVAGATGFAGALAAQLLWRHRGFELVGVTGRSEQGRRLEDLYPRYRVPLEISELDLAMADGLDAAVVAYPHAAAAPTVGELRARGVRVVDLSADFRLRSLQTYERWYGEHPRPDLRERSRLWPDRAAPRADRRRGHRGQPGLLSDRRACSRWRRSPARACWPTS